MSKGRQRPLRWATIAAISCGVGISVPTLSLRLCRRSACLDFFRPLRLRTTFCATVPRSCASASIEPRSPITRLTIAGERPAACSRSLKLRTAGTVSADSFTPPMNGVM